MELSDILPTARSDALLLAGWNGGLDCLIFAVCAGWLDARVFADVGVWRSMASAPAVRLERAPNGWA